MYLEAIEEKDLEQLRYWRNLPEYRKYFREYREISQAMQERWFRDVVNGSDTTIMFAIRMLDNNELMGYLGAVVFVILTGCTGILIYHCILEKIQFILIMKGLQKKAAGCCSDMLFVN